MLKLKYKNKTTLLIVKVIFVGKNKIALHNFVVVVKREKGKGKSFYISER